MGGYFKQRSSSWLTALLLDVIEKELILESRFKISDLCHLGFFGR